MSVGQIYVRQCCGWGAFGLLEIRTPKWMSVGRITCAWAAEKGHLNCLRYSFENRYPWYLNTCNWAAKAGHLDCLKYLHENGCKWGKETCYMATESGKLNCLTYLHENGCPWDEATCSRAVRQEHLNYFWHAYKNGCPWNQQDVFIKVVLEKFWVVYGTHIKTDVQHGIRHYIYAIPISELLEIDRLLIICIV